MDYNERKIYRAKDYTILDINPDSDPDIIADCSDMPQIMTDSIEIIDCFFVLEHIPDTLKTMKEFYRVLKPKGILNIIVPHALNPNLYSVPDHYKGFTYTTFNQFWQEGHNAYPKFKCLKRRLIMRDKKLQWLANKYPIKMEYLYWLFQLDSVEVMLEKVAEFST